MKPSKPTHLDFESKTLDRWDESGALRLAEKIEAYWRERGATVRVTLMQGGFTPQLRSTRFDLRSDMLNGWPREWIESK